MSAERVWPLGVADQQVITHEELTQLDLNASRAITYHDIKVQNWTRFVGPVGGGNQLVDRVCSVDPVNKKILAIANKATFAGGVFYSLVGEIVNPDWQAASITAHGADDKPVLTWLVTNPAGVSLTGGDNSPGTTAENYLYRSTNATNWASSTLPAGWTGTRCGLWDPVSALWVVAGMAAGELATSPDGITWTLRTLPAPVNAQVLVACDVDPTGKMYFQGNGGNGAKSDNGTSWTSVTSVVNSPTATRYNASEDLWMTVGTGGETITSPDRTTWTAHTGVDYDLVDLDFDGTLWVAAARRIDATSMSGIAYSLDKGDHWSFVALGHEDTVAMGVRHLRNSFWLAMRQDSGNLSHIYRSLRIGVDAFNNLG
jgi:hypothetical protein